jgi:hypothetical protein
MVPIFYGFYRLKKDREFTRSQSHEFTVDRVADLLCGSGSSLFLEAGSGSTLSGSALK